MTMLMTMLAEAVVTVAEFVAQTMTMGSFITGMNEPEMPKQLLKK